MSSSKLFLRGYAQQQVIFVCTGNTCRSQMAEALFGHCQPNSTVSSSGIRAIKGKPTSAHAIRLLQHRGIEWQGVSKPVALDISLPSLLLGMTQEHVDWLQEHCTSDQVIIERLDPLADIADPFSGDMQPYQVAMSHIERALRERFGLGLA